MRERNRRQDAPFPCILSVLHAGTVPKFRTPLPFGPPSGSGDGHVHCGHSGSHCGHGGSHCGHGVACSTASACHQFLCEQRAADRLVQCRGSQLARLWAECPGGPAHLPAMLCLLSAPGAQAWVRWVQVKPCWGVPLSPYSRLCTAVLSPLPAALSKKPAGSPCCLSAGFFGYLP